MPKEVIDNMDKLRYSKKENTFKGFRILENAKLDFELNK